MKRWVSHVENNTDTRRWVRVTLDLLLVTLCLGFAFRVSAQYTAPIKPIAPAPEMLLARLHELHYWTGQTFSLKEEANRQAVLAFQKVSGLKRSGKLDAQTAASIQTAVAPEIKHALHELHLEVDLNRQIMFIIGNADELLHILPVSTGSGQLFEFPGKGVEQAVTPRGHFRVRYKISGWRTSPLGRLYYPMYVTGGIAVHGASSVPPVPASHGCIRIPLYAAREVFSMVSIGTPVIVEGDNPRPPKQRATE